MEFRSIEQRPYFEMSQGEAPFAKENEKPPFFSTSSSLINALHELRILRSQLYRAAQHFETSFLQAPHKRVVLENSKDYAVKAFVNALDHLGTVSYKFNDALSQQIYESSTAQLQVACLKQRLQMIQESRDDQGLRQHLSVKRFPRYYRHYTTPDETSRQIKGNVKERETLSGKVVYDASETCHAKLCPVLRDARENRTLLWHLSANARSTLNEYSSSSFSNEFHSAASITGSEGLFLSEAEYSSSSFTTPQNSQPTTTSASNVRWVRSKAFTKAMQFVLDCSDCTGDPTKKRKDGNSCFPF